MEYNNSLDNKVSMIKYLEGRLLTHLEATFPEGKQLEAQKSIVRNMIWDWAGDFKDIVQYTVEPANKKD